MAISVGYHATKTEASQMEALVLAENVEHRHDEQSIGHSNGNDQVDEAFAHGLRLSSTIEIMIDHESLQVID